MQLQRAPYPCHPELKWLLCPCHPELLATLFMPHGTPGYPSCLPEHVIICFLFLMVLVCDKEREVLNCVYICP